jgi:choline-sulfatase
MADASPGQRPNVIFILSDDQGPWAAGCYGNPEIRTPHLDRLAADGVRFDRFFCASPVCSPARASLLTGRIPSQHGIHQWLHHENVGPQAIRLLDSEVAYTDILAAHGYTCGLSGKWHLGDSLTPQHGFGFWYAHQQGGGPYYHAPMIRDGQSYDEPSYVTDVITDEALGFLDRHHREPFYLSVHYTAPHSPWDRGNHPADLVDSYADCPFATCPQEPKHPWAISLTDHCLGNREMLQGYFAAVTALDANVGRILDRVAALGLRESTLIIFAGDNGFSCGHHGFWGKGNGTHPRNMYENSVRVPFIWSGPVGSAAGGAEWGRGPVRPTGGRDTRPEGAPYVPHPDPPAGAVRTDLVSAYDFLPTLLDFLGLPLPKGRNLPGHSFLPLLLGQPGAEREHVVVHDEYGPVRMLRTVQWKYVHRYETGPPELYDLLNDPEERENLAELPSQAPRVRELRGEVEEWFSRYAEPEHDGRREHDVRE